MRGAERPPLVWGALALLAALVATNVALVVLLRTGGPLIGVAFYAVLLALTVRGRRRDCSAAMVGGLVGLAVHAVEVVIVGWSAYPTLIALNLILPAVLVPVAWWASRQRQRVNRGK